MAYNLFIACELESPGQNYDTVREAIESLGQWHQFQNALFYVSTRETPLEAFMRVERAMDDNDKLTVINAEGGVVSNWDRPPIDAINAIWSVGV